MKRHSFHIFAILFATFLFSCSKENSKVTMILFQADSLMNTRPDSALQILEEAREEVSSCPRSQRMHYELLVAKAQNKAFVDFTTDSVMLIISDYYDRHGSPNERMLAHYLLGCTYRDLGEAPRTLECYKDAINCADTLSPDCDYRTMMSVCGQMAKLYDQQAMPLEEIEMNELAGKYALLCGDTINYLRSIELLSPAYSLLKDTARVFECTKKAYDLYVKYGYNAEASRCLPTAITTYILYKQYDKAKDLMDEFESKSGYFNADGSITPRKSHYYNNKGLYYLGISMLDSAEYYFQKLARSGYAYDASKGLIKVYLECGKSDSLIKYINFFEDAQDSFVTKLNMESVRQTGAMYDYSRNQRIAYEERLWRERTEKYVILLGFMFITIITIATYFHKKSRERKKQMVKKLTDEYLALSTQYQNAAYELEFSKKSFREYEIQKNQELETLNKFINNYREQFEKMNNLEKRIAFCTSSIVLEFKEMLCPHEHKYKLPTSKQWKALQDGVLQTSPILFHKLTHFDLTEQERRIAILTYLDFTGEEIATLMNSSSQRVSNAKRNANKKAFGKDETKSFKYNLTHLQSIAQI